MAEFCVDCINKIFEQNKTEADFILSKNLEFCEGCCKQKRIVIKEIKKKNFFRKIFLKKKNR